MSWGMCIHAGTNAATTSEGMHVDSASSHKYAVAKHMHAATRARTITDSQYAFVDVSFFDSGGGDDDDGCLLYTSDAADE